jgi:hypothetical protein
MKNSLLALSIAVSLLCVSLLVRKNHEVEAARVRAALAEKNRAAAARDAEEQKRRRQRLQTELRDTQLEALAAAPQAALEHARVPEPVSAGRTLSAIFRDAAMQEMMKDEARLGAARNVKALFNAGLAQQLHLNDQQSAALRDLLLQKSALFWEHMLLPMMTGELDEAGMAAAGKLLKQSFEENTAQLRALLGNDGYDVYQWFEKTQPDRDHAGQFSKQFAQEGQALSEDQQAELLGIMTDERSNFRFSFDLGDPAQLDLEHWYDNFTNDRIETFGMELQQLNERVLQRARAVLNPEQTTLLQSFLNRQLQKGRLTMLTTTAALGKNGTDRR